MQQLFQALLAVHVLGGCAGLITGTLSLVFKKGGRPHRMSGMVFTWGMVLAAVSALVISNLPGHVNLFLFAVGGFTLYMSVTGNRMVVLKQRLAQKLPVFQWPDYALLVFGGAFGLFLLYQGITGWAKGQSFGVVPALFGLICLNYVRFDLQLLFRKTPLQKKWLSNHITRMIGALIASYTAFLVVNVQVRMQWILWLLPTAIGLVLIACYLKKYRPAKGV